MKYIAPYLITILLPLLTLAQNNMTTAYVEKYKDLAIKEMKRTGIPASITLAQAILESGSGESNLAKTANNHFGIKCKTEWNGPKTYQNDDAKNECFRVYPTADSSFRDHSNFLKNRPYYASLFELDPVDDSAWAYGLKKAGYATERDYPQKLLKIIDDYELSQYNFPEILTEESDIAAIKKENIAIATIKDTITNHKKVTDSLLNNKAVATKIIAGTITPINTNSTVSAAGAATPTVALTTQPSVASKEVAFNTTTVIDSASAQNLKKDTDVKKATALIPYPINQRFKINQVTAIWGEKGRSFIEIANTYNIALYKLYKYNELPETELIEKDQIIFFGEKRKEISNKIHIVKNEETLYEISQSEAIQLNQLKLYNAKLPEGKLKNGTIVYLFNLINEPTAPILKDSTKPTDIKQSLKSKFKLPF